jgi:hypothetical protein
VEVFTGLACPLRVVAYTPPTIAATPTARTAINLPFLPRPAAAAPSDKTLLWLITASAVWFR